MIFKRTEGNTLVQNLKSTFLNGFNGLFASLKTQDFSFANTFSTSLEQDRAALLAYREAINNNVPITEAFKQTMTGASVAAQEFAKNNEVNILGIQNFTKAQESSAIGIMAQNKSFANCKTLINEYSNGCKNCGLSQEQFATAVGKSNPALAKYLSGLNGAKGSLSGYIASLISSKAATIALQVATIALNMALTMGISVALQALITGLNNFIHSAKNASETADELKSKSMEEAQAAQEEVSQLDELIEKYKELATSDTQDSSTRSEIRDAQGQIVDLVGQQANNLDLVNGKLNEQLNKLSQIQKQEADNAVESATSAYHNSKDSADKAIGEYSRMWLDGYEYTGDVSKAERDALGDYLQAFSVQGAIVGSSYGLNFGDTEDTLKQIYNIDVSTIQGKIDALNEMINRVKTTEGYAESDLYVGLIAARDYYEDYVDDMNEAAQSLADATITASTYDSELAEISVDSAETFATYRDKLIEIVKNSPDLSEALTNGDITESDIESRVTSYLSTLSQFSDYYNEWKGSFEGNTAGATKFSFSDLIGDDSSFTEEVDNYIEKVTTLKEALSDFQNGDFSNEDFVDLIKQFPELADNADNLDEAITTLLASMNTSMADKFAAQFGNMDTDDDVDALKNFQDAVLELGEVVGNTEFAIDINTEIDGMDKLFTAMKESVSSTGLTSESIKNLQSRYQDLENYDAARLFEKTANGIHLNTKALRELESAYEKQEKANIKDTLDGLIKQYNDLTEQINNAGDAASTSDLYAKRQDILDQINDTSTLAAQYDGLTSAFHKWEEAQSIGEEGDMYDSLSGSLEDIKQLYDDGLIGTNQFRTAIQLMSNQDLSTANIDELLAAYESGYSVMTKYFTDGSDGCLNFLNDVQNLNSEWAKMNEDGSWDINFGVGDDQDVADALGINVEAVQAIMRKLSDYGFDINLDSIFSQLDNLQSRTEEANQSLIDIGATDITFNFGTDDIDYLNEQIEQSKDLLNSLYNDDGELNVKYNEDDVENAIAVIERLIYRKQSLDDAAILKVDTSTADSDITNVISKLQEFKSSYNNLEVQTAIGADTTEAQTACDGLLTEISGMDAEILATLGIDTTSLDTLNSTINAVTPELMVTAGLDASLIEDYQASEHNAEGTVTWDNNIDKVTSWINQSHTASGIINWGNNTTDVRTHFTASGTINWSSSGSGKAQGSAFAKGVAYNSGTWGTKDSGTALGGEIGEEIVVRDGKYFTIGSDGAEFFNYKKGDIIFNAEQSRQIFANGKITNGKKRGVTYASGNAFAEGTAFSSGSGRITGSGKVKTTASNNSSKSSGGSSKSSSSSSDKDDTSIIDWIEVKIDRIERKIKKLSTIAESSFKTFSKRNKALSNEISQVTKEIDVQQQAYDRYIKEANSVGLSANLAKKVKNGTIDINEYDSDTADKIQEYQKWYEAALDCQQAIQDLGETISELYKQKFDNLVTEWTNKVQDLQHVAERTDAQTSRRSDYASEYVAYNKSKWANTSNIADYQSLVKNAQNQISVKTGELSALKSELNTDVANGSIEWGSEAYYEMLASIQDVENEIDDLNSDIIDYYNKISDAYKNMFEDIASEYSDKLSLAEHLSNEYNTAMEKAEAMGYASSSKYYELLRNEEQKQIAVLKSEQKDLSDALYSAVASGEIEVGSAAWYEMSQQVCDVTEQIQEAELSVIELNNSIRQIKWDNFDYLQDTISNLTDESDFLIDLLSSSNLYKDNGQLTDAGISTMGLHGVNYNVLMSQADGYATEILSLNKQIANDPANTTLIERRNELLSLQRDCIQATEDEKDAIKDLVSNGIDKELSSLKDLISNYTDALDSQKDLYNFQKKVEEQTKNIATLQKELSAYENDVTEETKAKIQQIKVDLEEAKEDLEETQYEQYISDQKKLLDELYDEYERILNERLDNIDALIEDMIAMVNGSAITINDTLNVAASSVGYTMTTEMSNLWSNAASELARSRTEQLANVTALINQMVANGTISQENANSILTVLGSGSVQEIQNAMNIISKLQENGELDTANVSNLISALNTQGTNSASVITTYGTDFSNKQTVTNTTLDSIKSKVKSILTAANNQAESAKQQVEAEQAAAASAAAAAQSAAKAASSSTKSAAASAAKSSTTTTTSSTVAGKKTSSTSTTKKNTTTTTTAKKTTTQGDGKIQVGDKVTFKNGKYYYDSYGGKPTGSKNVGKTVYITKINTKGSKPYHISTGSKLGSGDLGWLTKSQISGYISGAKEINRDELAWTNENYNKIGGETIVRKSDHAILSTLSKGSRVYNALASDNIWEMANNPGSFIMDNLLGNGSIDTSSISSGGNNDIEQNIDLDINIDNVEDLDDLLNQMKKSKDFEKLIQAIAVAPLTGTSINKKNRFNF